MNDLGRVKEILPSGRDYSITLIDGTTISCHYSDIVSALATKSNSDVTLIDPFQLIDWKEQTPPDHLYPKFKVFLDNFKNGYQAPLPAITYMDPQRQEANKEISIHKPWNKKFSQNHVHQSQHSLIHYYKV